MANPRNLANLVPTITGSGGNLGLGATPNTWSVGKAIQIGTSGDASILGQSGYAYLIANSYYNNGWYYTTTNFSTRYEQIAGTHRWLTAPSGTAGNLVTATQAMTLDTGGRLLIGSTSSLASNGVLQVQTPTGQTNAIEFITSSNGSAGNAGSIGMFGNGVYLSANYYYSSAQAKRVAANGVSNIFLGSGTTDAETYISFNTGTTAQTQPTEKLRIGTAGQIGIGGATYGTAGQVLTSGGASAAPSWTTVSGTPAGSTGQIQFNNSGSFGSSGSLTWDNAANKLAVACSPDVLNQGLTVGGIISMNSNWKLAFSYNPTFYISPSGNDTTGDGSNANPWATINRAMGAIPKLIPSGASYCEIVLKNGTYTLANIQYIRGLIGRGTLVIKAETAGSVTINFAGNYFEIFENDALVTFQGITFNQANSGTMFNLNNTFKVYIESNCALNAYTTNGSPGNWNTVMSINASQIDCRANITLTNEGSYGACINVLNSSGYYFSGTITKTGTRHGNAAFSIQGSSMGTFQNTINNFNIGVNMGQSHYDAEMNGMALANSMSITNCNIGIRLTNNGSFKNYYINSFSGTTTPIYYVNGWYSGTASSEYNLIGYNTSVSSSYRLQVNSQIYATSSTVATSDGRYKKDVVGITGALDIVKALKPVQFNWIPHHTHNFDTKNTTVGFIAQDVQQVLADKPYLNSIIKKNEFVIEAEEYDTVVIEPAKDEVYDETGKLVSPGTPPVTEKVITKPAVTEEFLGIAEGNLIAILTAAIQELKSEFDAYKASHP